MKIENINNIKSNWKRIICSLHALFCMWKLKIEKKNSWTCDYCKHIKGKLVLYYCWNVSSFVAKNIDWKLIFANDAIEFFIQDFLFFIFIFCTQKKRESIERFWPNLLSYTRASSTSHVSLHESSRVFFSYIFCNLRNIHKNYSEFFKS